MEKILLIRSPSDPQGTFGLLTGRLAGIFTLELPWHENQPDISCIPVGEYRVNWTKSPRFSLEHGFPFYTYQIMDVPGRGGIRMHGGNLAGNKPQYISQSLGCPLLGLKVGRIKNQKAVLASQMAVRKMENIMQRKNFILEIQNG